MGQHKVPEATVLFPHLGMEKPVTSILTAIFYSRPMDPTLTQSALTMTSEPS